jgi:hypothetical protein
MSLLCGSSRNISGSGERSQEPGNTAPTIQHAIMIFDRRIFYSVNYLE